MTRWKPSGPFDLTGRLALVTGASRGIGLGIASALADAGATVLGTTSSPNPQMAEFGQALAGRGRTLSLDLSDRRSVDAAIGASGQWERPIDILINNAGVVARAPAEAYTDEAWDRVIETNLTGSFRLTRGIGRRMLEAGRGKVVFIASILSTQGGRSVAAYTASKSGIAGVTRALASEWAGKGVNVNAIAPGYVLTDSTKALYDDRKRRRELMARIPAGRWGTPSDIGGAAIYLSASASDYESETIGDVHGAVLPVDGGWLAG